MRTILNSKSTFVCNILTASNPELNAERTWAYLCMAMDLETEQVVRVDSNLDDFMGWIMAHPKAVFYMCDGAYEMSAVYLWLSKNGWSEDEQSFRRVETARNAQGDIRKIDFSEGKSFYHLNSVQDIAPIDDDDLFKSFLPTETRLKIDEFKYRPEYTYEYTDEEYEYARQSCREECGIIRYLKDNELLHAGTVSGIALKKCEELVETRTGQRWRTIFPVLDKELNKELRKAYRGGFCWLNPRYKNVNIGRCVNYDANSMYPSQMLDNALPCRYPTPFVGKPEINQFLLHDLYIVRVKCSYRVKKGCPPVFGKSLNKMDLMSAEDPYLTLCNVDWELLNELYDVWDVEYLGGWYFRASRDILAPFVEYCAERKESSQNAERAIWKRISDSLYGKFASKTSHDDFIPYDDDGVLRWEFKGQKETQALYTPMAIFLTSYARRELAHVIIANWDRFIYCDTDCVWLVGDSPALGCRIHPTQFKAWKLDRTADEAKFLGKKRYFVKGGNKGEKMTLSGIPTDSLDISSISLDDFRYGLTFEVYMRDRKKGGYTLDKKMKTLKKGD